MTPEAIECRDYFNQVVSAETGGRDRAVHSIARATGLAERRILGIMYGEVKRIWADEMRVVREWHGTWRQLREARLLHEVKMMRAHRAQIGNNS